jgi:hypothetical protein
MKAGLTLVELATEVERRAAAKKDFRAQRVRMQVDTADGGGPTATTLLLDGVPIDKGGDGEQMDFSINDHAHGQIAQTLGIPKPFYDRLREGHSPKKGTRINPVPDVFDNLVNGLLHSPQGGTQKQLVRTLDGRARAFLSNRYRPLDNEELAEVVLPIVLGWAEYGNAEIKSSMVTDDRFYLKVVLPKIQRLNPDQRKVGDVVQSGFVVQNSEVGNGTLGVYPLVYTLSCLNGMIRESEGMAKYHVGRAADRMGDEVYEVFKDDTLKAQDEAFWREVRDLVESAADEARFNGIVDRMHDLAGSEKIVEPVEAVNVVAERFGLYEREKKSILTALIEGGDLTGYGMLNAITNASQKQDDYERATELEKAGGRMLDLTGAQWREIAFATA